MSTRALLPLCVALLLSGCAREHLDDCFTSTGKQAVDVRTLDPFTAIRLSGRVDLSITVDSTATPMARVEGGHNLLPHLITDVRDGELHVDNTIRCNWVRGLKELPIVRVTVPKLERLVHSGLGDMEVTGVVRSPVFRLEQFEGQGTTRLALEVDTCYIGLHSGVGDAVVTGTARVAYLYAAAFAAINAAGLHAERVFVNSSGSGDIHCRAAHFLNAQLYNAGDVYYGGAPAVVEADVSGTGRLIRVD